MRTDVRHVANGTKRDQRLDDGRFHPFRIDDHDAGQRRAAHNERHRVLAGVARLHVHFLIVLVRSRLRVLVWREPVLVLGMIVIGVRVHVQRGRLASSASQGDADQDGEQALHRQSVWKEGRRVKRRL